MSLIFEDLYKGADKSNFIAKVQQIAVNLGINPNWLMFVMKIESGLNPQAVNKQPASTPGYDENGQLVKPAGVQDSSDPETRAIYRATGLIQFMPKTAKGLDTLNEELYNMSGVNQLNYVYKYYLPYKGKIKSLADLYLITFFPAGLGKTDDFIFKTSSVSAEKIALANPGIDLNKDKKITLAEFKQFIFNKIPNEYKGILASDEVLKKKNSGISLIFILIFIYYAVIRK